MDGGKLDTYRIPRANCEIGKCVYEWARIIVYSG